MSKIVYVMSDLARVGPTNQTLNIIKYSGNAPHCTVITLFKEPSDNMMSEYLAEGINVICLNLSRKFFIFNGASILWNAIKTEGCSIVHSYGIKPDILCSMALAKKSVKHIITLRNYPLEDVPGRMNRRLGILVARIHLHYLTRCQNLISCSKTIENKMKKDYPDLKVTAIQNGVDFERFKACDRENVRRELGLKEDDVVYISTGSIIPRKRIEETADAFNMACLSDNYKLWFLGDGNLLPSLKEKYASNKNISFLGKKSEVSYYLSVADVFISSSESEGMPNAVLEAISCKLPVVLSDIPQHLEIFDSIPGCGEAYELGSVERLSNVIKGLNREKLRNMISCCEGLEESDLTMKRMGEKYRTYYTGIMNDIKSEE